jgi:hypothetical protein
VTVAVSGGSVVMAADRSLQFVPGPGFSGLAEIAYTVSDGRGGFATATIAIRIEAEVQAPVEAPAPAVSDPLPADPGRTADAPSGIVPRIGVEGVILETVAAIGGLHSAFNDLSVKHPLMAAVNGFGSLGGGVALAVEGRTLSPDRLAPFESSGRVAERLLPEPPSGGPLGDMYGFPPGGIVLGLDAGSGNRIVLGLETTGGSLVLNVREIGAAAAACGVQLRHFSATLANGDPLPRWLQWRGDFTLRGDPPPGAEPFDVRISVKLDDGAELVWVVTIDPRDGQLKAIQNERANAPETRALFSEQLRAAAGSASVGEAQSLADLIRSVTPEPRRAF